MTPSPWWDLLLYVLVWCGGFLSGRDWRKRDRD